MGFTAQLSLKFRFHPATPPEFIRHHLRADMTRPAQHLAGILSAAVVASLYGCGGSNNDNGTTVQPLSCAQLNGMTIAAASIGLPTTGAKVTSTQIVAAAGTAPTAVGE